MEIKKLLQVGVGKTGNTILNQMMELDNRYVGLFINTAKKDMINLSKFNDDNYYKIPQVDGTGRDREKAKEYLLRWQDSFIDLMLSYDDFDTIVFYFSLDGGTGSGCTPSLMNMVKKLYLTQFGKDINVIAVGILPKSNISTNGLYNTVECWNELMKLVGKKDNKGVINSLYLVDNNKRDTYEEINESIVEALNMAFTFNDYDLEGELDSSDSFNINVGSGYESCYNIILNLSNKYKNVDDAIVEAQENSIFVLPSDYASEYLGILTQNNDYSADKITDIIGIGAKDTYKALSEDYNAVFFGGLQVPSGAIDVVASVINSRNTDIVQPTEKNDLFVDLSRVKEKTQPKQQEQQTQNAKTPNTKKRIRQMASDDLFKF